jgi:hypothetical protein
MSPDPARREPCEVGGERSPGELSGRVAVSYVGLRTSSEVARSGQLRDGQYPGAAVSATARNRVGGTGPRERCWCCTRRETLEGVKPTGASSDPAVNRRSDVRDDRRGQSLEVEAGGADRMPRACDANRRLTAGRCESGVEASDDPSFGESFEG